jgi:hypothetical protein
VCVFVGHRFCFVCHHGGLWRLQQLHSRLVCTWKRGEWCFFIMENGGRALKQKKGSLFMIFGTSMMILHNTALKRPFPKLKKHHPTNLYMLYPMAQSAACVCVEKDKKMAPQGGIVHCHHHPFLVPQHLSVSLLAQPTTPQRADRRPYLQGTGAPRQYPHTLITACFLALS